MSALHPDLARAIATVSDPAAAHALAALLALVERQQAASRAQHGMILQLTERLAVLEAERVSFEDGMTPLPAFDPAALQAEFFIAPGASEY